MNDFIATNKITIESFVGDVKIPPTDLYAKDQFLDTELAVLVNTYCERGRNFSREPIRKFWRVDIVK